MYETPTCPSCGCLRGAGSFCECSLHDRIRATEPLVDFKVIDHGSIALLEPLSSTCEEWIEEHVGGEDIQYWGTAVVVEPRYLLPILEALEAEGFES